MLCAQWSRGKLVAHAWILENYIWNFLHCCCLVRGFRFLECRCLSGMWRELDRQQIIINWWYRRPSPSQTPLFILNISIIDFLIAHSRLNYVWVFIRKLSDRIHLTQFITSWIMKPQIKKKIWLYAFQSHFNQIQITISRSTGYRVPTF